MWREVGYGGAKWRIAAMSGVRRVAHVPWHPHPKLDDKGRLILPAKYCNELAGALVITRFPGALPGHLADREVR